MSAVIADQPYVPMTFSKKHVVLTAAIAMATYRADYIEARIKDLKEATEAVHRDQRIAYYRMCLDEADRVIEDLGAMLEDNFQQELRERTGGAR